MQIMGETGVETECGVCDFKQTADGRNYSEQNGRNAEEVGEAGATRGFDCSTRQVGVNGQDRDHDHDPDRLSGAPRSGRARTFYRFPAVLRAVVPAVCRLLFIAHPYI
jgi:hypothetical protein